MSQISPNNAAPEGPPQYHNNVLPIDELVRRLHPSEDVLRDWGGAAIAGVQETSSPDTHKSAKKHGTAPPLSFAELQELAEQQRPNVRRSQ